MPPLPGLEKEPERLPESDVYMRAFWQLSTERQVGFSVGQIPVSKIEEYGDKHGYDCITLDIFKQMIREMDAAYLKWLDKEREKDRKRKK